ncbi:MAG: twin-arginine translocase subunit TatC [Phycisphaerales bacterium]|jgi:sec-independent protein translocase protein TatC
MERSDPAPHHMPLTQHLEELRSRIIWALLGLIPIFAVSLFFGDQLVQFLVQPALHALREAGQPDTLQGISPLDVFSSYMKVSVIVAAIVGSPWLLYQLWRFVAPGLHMHERRFVYFLLPLSGVLTLSGVVFLYKAILPLMLSWLVTFGTGVGESHPRVEPLPQGVTLAHVPVLAADPPAPAIGDEWVNTTLNSRRVCIGKKTDGTADVLSATLHRDATIVQQFSIASYIGLLFTLTLAFAAAFQAPVVVLLLGWVGIVDRAFLKKYRRYAIFICGIIAAMITPGDPGSMIMMWVPLVLLYELGGVLLRVFPASRVAGPKPADDGAGEG